MNRIRSCIQRLFRTRNIILVFLLLVAWILLPMIFIKQLIGKNWRVVSEERAHTTLENYAKTSTDTLEKLSKCAVFISNLYRSGYADIPKLWEIAELNGIHSMDILHGEKGRMLSSHDDRIDWDTKDMETIQPIFEGRLDTIMIGKRKAECESGFLYFFAVSAGDNYALLIGTDMKELVRFPKHLGLGKPEKGVDPMDPLYVVLQGPSTILAASGESHGLEGFEESPFLTQCWQDSKVGTRTIVMNNIKVLETVYPFEYKDERIGLFRLGMPLAPPTMIHHKFRNFHYARIVYPISLIFFMSMILFAFVLLRENLDFAGKRFQAMDIYSNNIIQNVSDAVIVCDHESGIKIFNHAAEILFQKDESQAAGQPLAQILNQNLCKDLLESDIAIRQIQCKIKREAKKILVSKTVFTDQYDQENTILVLRDLTDLKRLEEQIQHEEHNAAIVQLASTVAHEIRNPLNTISTIIQQMGKDFEPKENTEEYHQLASLVFTEVQRINKTVKGFLNFAQLNPIKPQFFRLSDLINHISREYRAFLKKTGSRLNIDMIWDGEVYWDRQQMQQVLMNLIQNAIDELNGDGEISMTVFGADERELEIHLHDTGAGIPPNMQSKIFNLYFTTKTRGTGIGLSIVRRIVYEHGGTISVESIEGQGSTFILRMPRKTEA